MTELHMSIGTPVPVNCLDGFLPPPENQARSLNADLFATSEGRKVSLEKEDLWGIYPLVTEHYLLVNFSCGTTKHFIKSTIHIPLTLWSSLLSSYDVMNAIRKRNWLSVHHLAPLLTKLEAQRKIVAGFRKPQEKLRREKDDIAFLQITTFNWRLRSSK